MFLPLLGGVSSPDSEESEHFSDLAVHAHPLGAGARRTLHLEQVLP